MEEKIKAALKVAPKSNKELRVCLGMDTVHYDTKMDRTLQKLRKNGEIQVIGGKWALNTFKICNTCEGKGWVSE